MADVDEEIRRAQESRGTGFGELQEDDGVYTKDKFAGFEGSIGTGDMEEDDGEEPRAQRKSLKMVCMSILASAFQRWWRTISLMV